MGDVSWRNAAHAYIASPVPAWGGDWFGWIRHESWT
jgi:hypothetical protein